MPTSPLSFQEQQGYGMIYLLTSAAAQTSKHFELGLLTISTDLPSNISSYIHHIITIHPPSSISHHPSLPTSHHPSLPISYHPSLPIYYHVDFTVWSPSRVPISKSMLNSKVHAIFLSLEFNFTISGLLGVLLSFFFLLMPFPPHSM